MTASLNTQSDVLGFAAHDHTRCITDGMARAEQHCADAGLQLTPARRHVLEILLREHRALGAYEVLDHLRDMGEKAQPPVAYRALDFLVKHGFVHRIEKLNAFIACAEPGSNHAPAFLICRVCDAVAETQCDQVNGELHKSAQNSGFSIEAAVLEAEGICPNCQDTTNI